MSTELISAQLSEYLRFKNGKSSPDRDDDAPFPVYGSNGLIGHADKINSDQNTIIIGRVGSYCGSVHFSDKPCWVSDNAIICTSKNPEDSLFWYYFLTFSDLNQYRSGSGQPLLNQGTLNSISCEVPRALTERVRIGELLASFDKKQGLNHQINQTLEQMAQAIFKSWFVDFEPVKTRIAALEAGGSEEDALLAAMQAISGKGEAELTRLQAEQPEQYTDLRATAELFPSAMQDSELGEIPEGWLISNIEALSEKVAMGPFGSNIKVATFVETGIPIISGQHLKETLVTDGDNKFITPEHADKLKNSNVFPGDIIFTHAGTIGQVSLIPKESQYGRYVISQRQFYLRADKQKASPIFLVYFFRSGQGQHLLLSNASQVGVPSIARPSSHLKSIELVVPPLGLMRSFERLSQLLLSMTASLRSESKQLSDLRDTLLPRLLSGELSIKGAEEELALGEEPANV